MAQRKKWMLVSAAAVLLSMVVAGCASSNDSGGTDKSSSPQVSVAPKESSSPQVSVAPKEELPPYQIDWYIIGPGPQPDGELVEAEINKITQPKINATVKMHVIPYGDYEQKMTALLATGEKIDLMFSNSGVMKYTTMVGKGAFVDLTDKLDEFAPDAKKLLSDGFLQASTIKGRIYTLAANKEKGSWLGFFANKALMEKYNIDITKINSLADMEPTLKTIKDNEPDMIPLLATGGSRIPNFNNRNLWNVSPVNSIVLRKDGSGYTLELDEPEYMDTLMTLHKYYQEGYIPKDAAVNTETAAEDAKSAFVFQQLKPYVDVQWSNGIGAQVTFHAFGKPITTTNDLTGSMMAIPTISKDPDRVLMFYNMMYTDKQLINLVGRGIEGKHYVKVGENRIIYAPETEGGKKSGYNPNQTWAYGNQFLTYLMPGEPDDMWEQFKKFNDESEIMLDLGFNFDSSTLETEMAAIKNVENEFRPMLETGSVDPKSTVPKFKEKLKSAGIDKVLDEINKQYSEWLAAKK